MSTHSIGIRTLPFSGEAIYAGTVVALTRDGRIEAFVGEGVPLGVVVEDSDSGEAPVRLANCAGTVQVRAGDTISTGDLLVSGGDDDPGHLVPLDGTSGAPIAIAIGDGEEDALCEVMLLSGTQLVGLVYEGPSAKN